MTGPADSTAPGTAHQQGAAGQDLVEQAVDRAVGEVRGAAADAATSAQQASAAATASGVARDDSAQARDDSAQARDDSVQARDDSVQAGTAAIEAASVVAADDPLLDTAVRRLEAQVDADNPYGRIGQPMNRWSPFRIGFTAALGVALAYGLVQSLIAVRSVLILLLVSGFLAIGLDPAVRWLERRRLSRGRAVAVVLLAVLLFFVGVAAALVPPIIVQGQQFVAAVPDYVQNLQDNQRIAQLDARYHILDQVQTALNDPARIGGTVFGGVIGVGKILVSAFFSALTVLILTLYFLSNLPTMKVNAYRLVPRSRRARVGLLADEILTRVGGYVAGALGIATIAGVTTFVLLLVIGVPYPLALALLVALTDLIPLVGATIGAAIITLVAFSISLQVGIIAAVYYLAYQQLENYVLYPRIMKRSVDVSPAATIIAVLIGASLLGVIGALLAIPIAAAVQLVLGEVVAPRQDAA